MIGWRASRASVKTLLPTSLLTSQLLYRLWSGAFASIKGLHDHFHAALLLCIRQEIRHPHAHPAIGRVNEKLARPSFTVNDLFGQQVTFSHWETTPVPSPSSRWG